MRVWLGFEREGSGFLFELFAIHSLISLGVFCNWTSLSNQNIKFVSLLSITNILLDRFENFWMDLLDLVVAYLWLKSYSNSLLFKGVI